MRPVCAACKRSRVCSHTGRCVIEEGSRAERCKRERAGVRESAVSVCVDLPSCVLELSNLHVACFCDSMLLQPVKELLLLSLPILFLRFLLSGDKR